MFSEKIVLLLMLSVLVACEHKIIVEPTYVCSDSNQLTFTDVQPVLQAKCAISSCHNGSRLTIPTLISLQDFKENSNDIKSQFERVAMPPSDAAQLTEFEKAKILCWINQGSN